MDEKGRVAVSGPIDNTVLCYGLLEVAKDSLRAHAAERAQKIQTPHPSELLAFGKKQ